MLWCMKSPKSTVTVSSSPSFMNITVPMGLIPVDRRELFHFSCDKNVGSSDWMCVRFDSRIEETKVTIRRSLRVKKLVSFQKSSKLNENVFDVFCLHWWINYISSLEAKGNIHLLILLSRNIFHRLFQIEKIYLAEKKNEFHQWAQLNFQSHWDSEALWGLVNLLAFINRKSIESFLFWFFHSLPFFT